MQRQWPDRMNRRCAAEYLGVTYATLEAWAVRGGGPYFYKIGRRVVYVRGELDAWMAARRVQTTSDYDSMKAQLAVDNN